MNAVLLATALIASAVAVMAWTGQAFPHDALPTAAQPKGWAYPFSCCWGPSAGRQGDCHDIPASAVVEGPNGYEVTLAPGDHPMIKAPMSFAFPYGREQIAPDGLYHVCFAPDLTPRCFFAGAHGS
jgi:hypothetical protein